jgi:sirohydrochlorin cobaltochelatase
MRNATPTPVSSCSPRRARDPRWADWRVAAARRSAMRTGVAAGLAFLEFMTPDVSEAARRLAARGVRHIHVIPLFFGPGGHLRNELPQLARAAMAALPGLVVEVAPAAGEDDGVIGALAAYALRRAAASRLEGAPGGRGSVADAVAPPPAARLVGVGRRDRAPPSATASEMPKTDQTCRSPAGPIAFDRAAPALAASHRPDRCPPAPAGIPRRRGRRCRKAAIVVAHRRAQARRRSGGRSGR